MHDDKLDPYLLRLFAAREQETLDAQAFMDRLEASLGETRGGFRLRRAVIPSIPRAAWTGILRSLRAPLRVSPVGWAGTGAFVVLALLLKAA